MKAVFLDRDNTLIVNEGDLGDPARLVLTPGVGPALRAVRERGYRLIVVTNQGGVARGRYTERDVDAVHQRIAELIDIEAGVTGLIDRFYYCPYHPEGTVPEYRREHPWRKPQPGMLIQAARDLDLDLPSCWMIGDQQRDIAAGNAAGCRTILVSQDAALVSLSRSTLSAPTLTDAARLVAEHAATTGRGRAARDAVNDAAAPRRDGDWLDGGGGGGVGAVVMSPRVARPVSRSAMAGRAMTPVTPQVGIAVPEAGVAASEARSPQSIGSAAGEFEPLRRAVHELTEEIRTERLRRTDFTPLRMAAGLCQLSVLLLALLGLLQVNEMEPFTRWMLGAVLMQLLTITLLLVSDRS